MSDLVKKAKKQANIELLDYSDVVRDCRYVEAPIAKYNPNRIAVITHTSGTSGKPKPIPLTDENLNAYNEQTYFAHMPVAVGDKALGTVQDVVLAGLIQNSGGLLAGSVGTGVGLGQTEGADLAAGAQVGQILHLLLLGAVLKDGSAAQGGVSGNDNSGGAADLSQLFHTHSVSQNVAAGAAVLLGEVDAHHAQLSHLLDGLHGEALFLIDLLGQGLDLVLGELAVHLADHLMLFRQVKIHLFVLLFKLLLE